jgi:squalene-hopene/tetraprenyl-beta-curcumene cyclase
VSSIAAPTSTPVTPRLDACIDRAVEALLRMRHPDGYWWAELEANATMAAEHLLLEQFLGIGDEGRWRKIVAYLLRLQQPDGSWPIYYGGPGDVSVTTEAYFALKVAGVDPDSPAMKSAREFVRAHGGVGATRVFTRLWLALFGQFDWEGMPAMPPETILLPDASPVNIYRFASWARATIVPILVVWAHRPVAPLPPRASIAELCLDPRDRQRSRARRDHSMISARDAFLALDGALKLVERLRWKPLRARALRACERWILDHQEADGSWGGIQPPWVYSLIALKCLGYENDHPVMRSGMRGLLDGFAIETDNTFTVQPCVSPVWDTALAVIGLREAGLPADHPALTRAGRWLLGREIHAFGDWARSVRGIEPGGWPFEFANERYPDTDDTAEVLLALRLLGFRDEATHPRTRALRWLRAMQSSNGGWGAFDRDNTSTLVTKIPFCDFGATIDPPSEDVTAHIVETFALHDVRSDDPMMSRAIKYLWRTQEPDGSWFGRWGVNYIYGLGAVVPALIAAGADQDDPRITRAIAWIEAHQNEDGGWGETCASYGDLALRGSGASTPSQTAWALLALLAAGRIESDAVRGGVEYLIERQQADGRWEEPQFTGTGFPRDFMLSYHLYRQYWPLWALGRYRRMRQGALIHVPGSDPLA